VLVPASHVRVHLIALLYDRISTFEIHLPVSALCLLGYWVTLLWCLENKPYLIMGPGRSLHFFLTWFCFREAVCGSLRETVRQSVPLLSGTYCR
jgi:hypothetical protein